MDNLLLGRNAQPPGMPAPHYVMRLAQPIGVLALLGLKYRALMTYWSYARFTLDTTSLTYKAGQTLYNIYDWLTWNPLESLTKDHVKQV